MTRGTENYKAKCKGECARLPTTQEYAVGVPPISQRGPPATCRSRCITQKL